MDVRPSRSHRSPLARLTGNQQNQRNRKKNDPNSTANGGRTTRSTSCKVRKRLKIEEGNENISRQNSATSDDADDCVDSETHVVENRIRISRKEKKNTEPKLSVAPKKKKFKMKKRTSVGRWEPWEKLEFLRGLRHHGKGHWKKIGEAIPTRTTVQVKTHAQVMLRKLENGVDIFEALDEYEATRGVSSEASKDQQKANKTSSEENSLSSSLDEHEAMQEPLTEDSNDGQKPNDYGPEVDRLFSSFPLPRLRRSMRQERKSRNAFHGSEDRCTNEPQSMNSRRTYNLGQSNMGDQFETSSMAVPSLFQPVTTTTVTTTMVGNHTLPNVFRPPNHHFCSMNHPSFIQHHDPYRFTPSFDGIARSSSTAPATVATSAFFPANTFHVLMAPRANPGSSASEAFPLPSQNNGVALHADEVEAIRVLVAIGGNFDGDFPQSQNATNLESQENDEPMLFAV